MPFKSLVRVLMKNRGDHDGNKRNRAERKCMHSRGWALIAPERCISPLASSIQHQSQWANLPLELLSDIIRRIEISETSWPARRDVIACAAVCRSWRKTTKEVVRTPEQCGLLTFPMSLKQPGPRDSPIQCFIKRERTAATYQLYLGLSPALSGDSSKLLMAARRIRRTTKTEFLISLFPDDFSQASEACVGKLRSNFIGTKFIIYDSQLLYDSAIQSIGQSRRKFRLKHVSPRIPVYNYNPASISYELNVLRTRGPRRMQCTLNSIPVSAILEGGTAETHGCSLDEHFSSLLELQKKNKKSGPSPANPLGSIPSTRDPLVLKNKAPRWHEQLQCWCLNFRGRVTVASVKNFQLVAAVNSSLNVPATEQEKVILQFGKIGKDIFTMDYCYPLSAFQAFAICLSSFDTKPACE